MPLAAVAASVTRAPDGVDIYLTARTSNGQATFTGGRTTAMPVMR